MWHGRELENYEEGEKKEMVELYTDGEYGGGREKGKGLKPEEAQQVIDIMARNKDFFVDRAILRPIGQPAARLPIICSAIATPGRRLHRFGMPLLG